jgi:glycosyltransferase involved in cell wall biosynthesis
MVEVSIIAPTMYEERAPEIAKEIFGVFGRGVEVIIVDKSNLPYRKLFRNTGAKVIVQKTKGYEGAVMEGFRAAKGTKVLASIDPDGTYSVKDLRRVIDTVINEGYDFVSGDRSGCSSEAMLPHLKLGNFVLALIFDMLFLQRMRDVFSGSFAMKREAFDSIKDVKTYHSGTLLFEMELAKRGYRLKNIHISYEPRRGTESKLAKSKVVYGFKTFKEMLKVRGREASQLIDDMLKERFK